MQTSVPKKLNATTIRFDDDYTQMVIDKAAELLSQTRTGFILSTAREKAEEVIKERTRAMAEVNSIVLNQEESIKLIKLLENPPKANKALKTLMKDYKNSNIIVED